MISLSTRARAISATIIPVFLLPLLASASGSQTYTTTGVFKFTVPAGVNSISAFVWGAGGGGDGGTYDPSYYGFGGAGGYTAGTIAVTPGEALSITVGGGGLSADNLETPEPGGAGGGGAGGGGDLAGSGGGMSGIFNDSAPLLIAGGGGGGVQGGEASDMTHYQGGAGGGATGQDGSAESGPGNGGSWAQGGTQTSGGAHGGPFLGTDGSRYQGGDFVPTACDAGAGGGGGYYGGGSGSSSDNGCYAGYQSSGGGGSGYVDSSVLKGVTTAGNDLTPPETDSPYYIPGVGIGGGPAGGISGSAVNGGNGAVVITWTATAPTCSVTLSPNPSPYAATGTPVSLSWSSSNADEVYINTLDSWETPFGGPIGVASQSNTDYSCYGYSASTGDGPWTSALLKITPPSTPMATLSASSTSIYTNQSTNVTADFSVGSGDQLTADNIDGDSGNASPWRGGLGASTTADASKSITFTPTQAGTYTFYARLTTDYYSSWATYATTAVTVTKPTSCTPSVVYGCEGNNIVATSTSATCTVTVSNPYNSQICSSPQYCQAGSSSCLAPTITFNQSGSYSGNLQLLPAIVPAGGTTQVHWSVENAQSCTVKGTNGDSWSGLSSPPSGKTSGPINSQTIYTLSCGAYDNNPSVTETGTVNVMPVFREL